MYQPPAHFQAEQTVRRLEYNGETIEVKRVIGAEGGYNVYVNQRKFGNYPSISEAVKEATRHAEQLPDPGKSVPYTMKYFPVISARRSN